MSAFPDVEVLAAGHDRPRPFSAHWWQPVALVLIVLGLAGWYVLSRPPSAAATELAVWASSPSLVQIDVDSGLSEPVATPGTVSELHPWDSGLLAVLVGSGNDSVATVTGSETASPVATAQVAADNVFVTDAGTTAWVTRSDTSGRTVVARFPGEDGGTPRWRPLPANSQIVGAVNAGLVIAVGRTRDRVLRLFDPAQGVVVQRLGRAGLVLGTGGNRLTMSLPCFAGDCAMFVINATSGDSRQLMPPTGTVFSGRPTPSADGAFVAAVVRRLSDGSPRLAVGPIDGRLVVVDDVPVQLGAPVIWGSGSASDWLMVAAGSQLLSVWQRSESRPPIELSLPEVGQALALTSAT